MSLSEKDWYCWQWRAINIVFFLNYSLQQKRVRRHIRRCPVAAKYNFLVASDLRHNSTKGPVYQMRWNLFGYISLVPIRFSFYAKRRSNLARASEDAEKTFNRDNAIEEWSKLNSLATKTLLAGLVAPRASSLVSYKYLACVLQGCDSAKFLYSVGP